MVLDTAGGNADDFATYMGTQTDDRIVFGGTNHVAWNGSDDKMLAYCFASVEGYSKMGQYIGNGATSGTAGTYVYLGFRPSFVMLKSTGTGSWGMLDSTRDPFNEALRALQANAPADEEAYSGNFLDFYSNGFAPRTSGAQVNAAGTTYIYMAFAEAPFKYATAK